MQIQLNGWNKVYIFYGAIFFGLGLFGFLGSRFDLSKLTRFIVNDFSSGLAEVGLIKSQESREVIVKPSRLPVVLTSFVADREIHYLNLVEQIKGRIQGKAWVVHYSVPSQDWLKSNQIISLINEQQFLIGLDKETGLEDSVGFSIVFTIPKTSAAILFKNLVNYRPELPLFQLVQISSRDNSLYRLNFIKPPVSSAHWMAVVDVILETWKTIGYKRFDNAFQF